MNDDEEYVDLSEQGKDWTFATPETLRKRKADKIQVWVEDDRLNTTLEDAAMEIRRAITYISGSVSVKMLDYSQIDVPNARSDYTDMVDEPQFVKRYFRWSREVIRRIGYKQFITVVGTVIDNSSCDLDLFVDALELYEI
jgi:hypothetical protein